MFWAIVMSYGLVPIHSGPRWQVVLRVPPFQAVLNFQGVCCMRLYQASSATAVSREHGRDMIQLVVVRTSRVACNACFNGSRIVTSPHERH